MKRRHTPCLKPLFEKWLEEWKDYAIQTGNPIHYSYGKALASLRQCPLRFESGKTCLLVRNFGPKLCDMLDKKLAAYRAENNIPPISEEPIVPAHVEVGGKVRKIDNQSAKAKQGDDAGKNKKIKKVVNSPIICRPYIPKVGSAAYAILVTLYKKSLESNYPGYMFKKDIITEAQSNCDCEMKSNTLQHYAGWSSMTTLIEKDFVVKKNCPAKYSLTDAGLALAISLYEGKSSYQTDEEEGVNINDRISPPSTSISNESKSTKSESNGSKSSGSKSNGSKNSRCNKSSGSKLSEENLNNQDIVNLFDDYNDDVFERDTKETENTKLDFCEKMKSKTLHKASTKSASNSDDDYDTFCKENPESVITVKRTEQHFIFREVIESHGPLNEINNKMDSQGFVDEGQKKIETAIKGNEKVVEKSHPKKNSVDDTPSESFFLLANNFDIILLVDTQETSGNKTKPNDATISELSKSGILYEVRSLKVGDFLWIARCRLTDRELVLPYIVERKRMDDLSGSIKDGRYHEQKFRLRQSGIEHVTYLVENYGGTVSGSIPLTSLFQAAVNSFIHEDFTIKFTKDHRDSMRYLSRMTKSLTSKFEGKELWCCSKKDLQPGRLMAFHEFNKAAVKTKKRTVKQMLVHQLLQLKGVSAEKAMAIADLYPTPKILTQAFHQADDKLLANIESGSLKRKLGLTISKTFHQLYTRYNLS